VSYRISQLSPHASTRGTRLKIVVRGPGGPPAETLPHVRILRFRRADDFLENDFEAGEVATQERSKWNILLGALVVLGVSGGFWTGVGMMIARLLR